MKLRKAERQQQILSEFRSSPATRLGELSDLLEVSKETIRRDITEMSRKGLLSRTYGGAVASSLNYEPQMRDRMRINPAGRRRMAEVASRLVSGLPILMIDGGATMVHVTERLVSDTPRSGEIELTVITNGLRNVTILAENPSIRVIVTPGDFSDKEASMFGPMTLEFLAGFRADAMLTSSGGIGTEGVMDPNSGAASVKRAMIRQTTRSILVVDAEKFQYQQFERVCGLEQIDDVVTDASPPSVIATALKGAGVEVHIAA
jgi:DeoR/GlpR family transcriptional regulator of sugar metabolism